MPKHEALTAKAIGNRIKAKGLQKLRWYCQMCQKQCRDENGFKCHTSSESHQRQLLLFADNSDTYLDTFSQDFEDGYLELLRRRFGTKRVHSNQVYQEYITDRHHTHMNSTEWETLTDFVKFLGRTGKCNVDQTEKGWFVTYIDRDPETIKRQEALAKKEKLDKDDQEKMAEFINKQIEKANKESTASTSVPVFTELLRQNEEEKVSLNLAIIAKPNPVSKSKALSLNALEKPVSGEPGSEPSKKDDTRSLKGEKRKKSTLDEIMEETERAKEKQNRKDNWLMEGIVVKVIAKSLGEKYYKQKAVVQEVQNLYTAVVKMIDTRDVLKLDQAHLETVIPAIGRTVKVVNGAYRGSEASLDSIDERKFSCSITIKTGLVKGRVLHNLPYEDISKLNISS